MLQNNPVEVISHDPCVLHCKVPVPENLKTGIRMLHDLGARSCLVMATAADRWDPDEVRPVLADSPLPVCGGVFPAVFHGNRLHDDGTLLIGLPVELTTQVIPGLSTAREDLLDQISSGPIGNSTISSLLTFVDSRRQNAEFLVDGLYDVFGEEVVVTGGGVGSLVDRFVPCIMTNAGLVSDAALLVGLPGHAIHEFEHGWLTLDGPHVITAADGTRLETINHKPAAAVYMEAIERRTGWKFADEEFRKISSLYPLGIEQPAGPHLVRDPLSVEGEALICVGEVPEGAIIQILKGDRTSLVDAARRVSQIVARERLAKRSLDPALLFAWDCASRRKYLLEDFQQELTAISTQVPEQDQLIGATTLAEVASTADGTIRLLNKSLVMMYP